MVAVVHSRTCNAVPCGDGVYLRRPCAVGHRRIFHQFAQAPDHCIIVLLRSLLCDLDCLSPLVRDLRTVAPDLTLTVDDVATQGDRVIGQVTQMGGGASERRIIVLTIDDGVVQEYWSWAAQPAVPSPFGLRAGGARQPAASAH